MEIGEEINWGTSQLGSLHEADRKCRSIHHFFFFFFDKCVEAFTILLHVYLYILSCPPLPKQNDFIMFSFTVDNTKENKCNFNLYILKLYYLCIEELNNCKNNLMTLNRFFIFFCFFLLSNFSLYFLFLVFSFENQYIYIYICHFRLMFPLCACHGIKQASILCTGNILFFPTSTLVIWAGRYPNKVTHGMHFTDKVGSRSWQWI